MGELGECFYERIELNIYLRFGMYKSLSLNVCTLLNIVFVISYNAVKTSGDKTSPFQCFISTTRTVQNMGFPWRNFGLVKTRLAQIK